MDGTKKKRIRNWVASIAAVCFAGWLGLVGYVNWAMHQPPEVFGHVMAKMPMPAYFVLPFETLWMRARHGKLNVGDAAPDLVVKKLKITVRLIWLHCGRTVQLFWFLAATRDRLFGGRFPP